MIVRPSPQDPNVWLSTGQSDEPVSIGSLLPGSHVVLLSENPNDGIVGRRMGLEVRDSILVLSRKGTSFAFLFRKPCSEGTVAENVLRYGTGALNIDGCRINTGVQPKPCKAPGWDSINKANSAAGYRPGEYQQGEAYYQPSRLGRWPTNLVFVHEEGCRRAGTKRVPNIGGSSSGMSAFGQNSGWNPHNNRVTTIDRHRDADGLETIQAWECHEGCPVAELDRMSGIHTSNDPGTTHVKIEGWGMSSERRNRGYAGDSGGASRFFPQFESEDELLGWLQTLIGV